MSNAVVVSAAEFASASGAPAHPLAVDLASTLSGRATSASILVLGVGSGRNIPVLLGSGYAIDAIEEDARRALFAQARFSGARFRVMCASYAGPYALANACAGALSTHALLHGLRHDVVAGVAAVGAALTPGGPFYATFGSTSDPRCGSGARLERHTFAPTDGSERGVPHAYFNESDVRTLLAEFEIERLEERSAAETAGRWAHSPQEAAALVHWFVRASARRTRSG